MRILQEDSVYYKLLAAVLLIFLQCSHSKANDIRIGTCPVIQPVELAAIPFAPAPVAPATTATGVWYEQRRYHSRFESSLTCVTYTFTIAANAAGVSVTITGRRRVTGRTFTITGTVIQRFANDFNRYSVVFNQGLLPGLHVLEPPPTNYLVAAADVANDPNWLVLYSCKQFGFFYIADSWILFAVRYPPIALVGTAVAAAQAVGVPVDKYVETDQTYCP